MATTPKIYRRITEHDKLIFNAAGDLIGIQNPNANGDDLDTTGLAALVSSAGNSLAIIGDSFSARWYNASGLTVDYQGKGFITWALSKFGGGLTVISDSSIGQAQVSLTGSPTSPLVTQIDAAVASGAKHLLMMGGINDVLAGVSSDTIKAAWLEILTKAKAASMRVWWCTQPGLGASSTAYTAARQAQIFELNRWIKQQQNTSAARRDVMVIDLAGIVQDPTSATGDWRSGYLNSTEADPKLHPAQPGAMAMGFEVARVWAASGLVSPSILPTSNADNKAYNSASNILNTNGLLVTTGGTNGTGSASAAAWVTATVYGAYAMVSNASKLYVTVAGGTSGVTAPTHTSGTASDGTVSWVYVGALTAAGVAGSHTVARNAGSSTCATALSARADGFGNDQVVAIPFGANNDSHSAVTTDAKASATIGRWYRAVCELTTQNSTNLRSIRVQLAATATSSAISNWGQLDADSDPDTAYAQELAAVVAFTKPFQYTADLGAVSNLSAVVRAFGSGAGGTVIKFGRLGLEEVAAP